MKVRGKSLGRVAVAGGLVALMGSSLTACKVTSLVARPTTPVVLTGAQVPSLVGTAPGRVVAFRHNENGDGTGRAWTQIPVQVDERKVVPFGSQPANNTVAGTTGTVYGSGSGGPTALQYADAGTWVGADTDVALDADDEIAFMSSDAGGSLAPDVTTEPAGVVSGSGVAVRLDDPRGTNEFGFVYLFASTGGLDPSAGKDYVDYDFTLTSGDYKTTYKRRTGPNPETSKVVTPTYEAGFSDRWKDDSWMVKAPGASGVDVLDALKNQFAINFCGRSNATFAAEEGAFVANIDGPVRAIRSYVGANSGPLTQRTTIMYRDQIEVITDLRVHDIPGVMDFVDYSAAAQGMTYRSSTVPGGVPIDGVADSVPSTLAGWEAIDGPQGQILTTTTYETDIVGATAYGWFYRDQTTPPEQQCWGDSSLLGASGSNVTGGIPNTDPREAGYKSLKGRRTIQFGSPAADPSTVAATAADWAADLGAPLTTTITRYQP